MRATPLVVAVAVLLVALSSAGRVKVRVKDAMGIHKVEDEVQVGGVSLTIMEHMYTDGVVDEADVASSTPSTTKVGDDDEESGAGDEVEEEERTQSHHVKEGEIAGDDKLEEASKHLLEQQKKQEEERAAEAAKQSGAKASAKAYVESMLGKVRGSVSKASSAGSEDAEDDDAETHESTAPSGAHSGLSSQALLETGAGRRHKNRQHGRLRAAQSPIDKVLESGRRLGEGTFGAVFRVKLSAPGDGAFMKDWKMHVDPAVLKGREFAVKVLEERKKDGSVAEMSKDTLMSAMSECDVGALFADSKHVASCLAAGPVDADGKPVAQDGTKFYVVMPLAGDMDLSEYFRRQRGKMSASHIALIMAQVLAGVQEMSDKGLIHHDLKPGNVMIDSSTANTRIIDLGGTCVSKFAHSDIRSRFKDRLDPETYTPVYRGPDGGGVEVVNPKVWAYDLTAVGLMTQLAMCGQRRWEFDKEEHRAVNLPSTTKDTCATLLSSRSCPYFPIMIVDAVANDELKVLEVLQTLMTQAFQSQELSLGFFSGSHAASNGPEPRLLITELVRAAGWKSMLGGSASLSGDGVRAMVEKYSTPLDKEEAAQVQSPTVVSLKAKQMVTKHERAALGLGMLIRTKAKTAELIETRCLSADSQEKEVEKLFIMVKDSEVASAFITAYLAQHAWCVGKPNWPSIDRCVVDTLDLLKP